MLMTAGVRKAYMAGLFAVSEMGGVHTAALARMSTSEYVVRWRTNANP
jgi:hypothetical protein